MSAAPDPARIAAAIAALLAARRENGSICPSEVARHLAAENWRALLPSVRAVAIEMARSGQLRLMQRGRKLDPREPMRGPIRLARI